MLTDKSRMIAAEISQKSNVVPSAEELLIEGASFSFQLKENANPLFFLVVMTLDDGTFLCKSLNKTAVAEGHISRKEITALCPVGTQVCTVRVKIKKLSASGEYIAITPVTKPTALQQRKSFRLKTDEDISYRVQFDGTGNIYKGARIEDISEGGLGILVHAAGSISRGTKVRISVELARHSEPIHILGEVAHCSRQNKFSRAYRIGICFADMKAQDKQAISDYVRMRAKPSRLHSA